MRTHKLQVKLFIEQNGKALELEPFVPVFHDWIRKNALGELLIDVADYAHVHQGPGVVLVGDGSDYFIDLNEGRPGLLYSRKRHAPTTGSAERIVDAFQRTLRACQLLESEPALAGHVRFKTDELVFRVVDRVATSNDDANFEAARAEVEPVLQRLYAGTAFKLERVGTPRQLLTIKVTAPGAPSVSTLLERVGAPS